MLFVLSVLFSLESVDLPPGHEIKTPLTIIRANADLLEMDIGDNECLNDIRQQTQRLTTLTNELVYLARMEEAEDSLPKMELSISDIVQKTVNSFQALAQIQKKELVSDIEPMLFSHVFERFYRMDRSRNSETGGHFHYHKHFFSE